MVMIMMMMMVMIMMMMVMISDDDDDDGVFDKDACHIVRGEIWHPHPFYPKVPFFPRKI